MRSELEEAQAEHSTAQLAIATTESTTMSLKEAYTLAHTAQCRLNLEAGRPDRNLRFVVGHLMHYESLRLRIVEIEHDVSRSERASAVSFKGTGHVDHHLQHKPSTGQLRRKTPPPPLHTPDADNSSDSDEFPDDFMNDEEVNELSLERFPTGSARLGQMHQPADTPELEPDTGNDAEDEEEDEAISPEEPDAATLEQYAKGDGSELLATMYEGVRRCPCHGTTDAPKFERMWELPSGEKGRPGVTRAVAVAAD